MWDPIEGVVSALIKSVNQVLLHCAVWSSLLSWLGSRQTGRYCHRASEGSSEIWKGAGGRQFQRAM